MPTVDHKPKHKPSEKHTLDEVLKSLQDLIRNDLIAADAPAAGGYENRPAPPTAGAAVPRDAGDLDAVLQSLKDLVTNELTTIAATSIETVKPARDKKPRAPRGGVQVELPLDGALPDHAPAPATAKAAPPAGIKSTPASAVESPRPAVTGAPTDETPGAILAAAATAAETHAPDNRPAAHPPRGPDPDNIPVLEDVALPPPGAEIAHLPTPDRARAIAIQVIAKLNIELRRRNERALDPKTIDRLQLLLQEALEQGTAYLGGDAKKH